MGLDYLSLDKDGWVGGGGGVFRCKTFLSNPREVCAAMVQRKFIYLFTRKARSLSTGHFRNLKKCESFNTK